MPRPEMKVLGTTGLKEWGGYVYEEFNHKLQGRRGVRTYREMADNSPIIGAVLFLIETFSRQVEWRIEPADESEEAGTVKDFVDECLFKDMSHTWQDFLCEVLSFVPFGWSYFEVVWKVRGGESENPEMDSDYDDGRFGIRKISIRSQSSLLRWEISEDGEIKGMWQQPETGRGGTVFLPIEKSLLFRFYSNKNNPEGRSLLRNVVRSYYFVKRMEEVEAIGTDRDLAGYPVMEVPMEVLASKPTANNAALRNELEKLIRNIRRDENEGALIPTETDDEGKATGFKLKLLSTGGSRQLDTDKIIKRHETRIAMNLLAEFIMLGMDTKGGSFALSSNKTHVFSVALGAMLDSIADNINRHLIPKLMKANAVPKELWPKLVHGDIEAPPLSEIGSFLVQLAQAGFDLTDDVVERKVREFAGLPQKIEDDEMPVELLDIEGDEAPEPTLPGEPATVGNSADPRASLNGAQVTALLQIIERVAAGQISKETALQVVVAAFAMERDQAEALLADVQEGSAPADV